MEHAASFEQWSDEKVLSTCVFYGEQALMWRRKFLGLLPEVQKRKLYEKRSCSSIFEFAKKLAGISEEQVRLVLNLERRFEDKPALHQALVNGDVSMNKLARVVSIATTENAEELAEMTKILPKDALSTYARDVRIVETASCENTELFSERLPGHSAASLVDSAASLVETETAPTFHLTPEVQTKLQDLHHKGIDINTIILDAIKQREQEIEENKETIGEQCQETNSRYIPQATKDLLKKEHGDKCSIKTCAKPSEEIHHTCLHPRRGQRWSMAKTHDPRYMAPLCKSHHTIAHSIDQKYQERRRTTTYGAYATT